jgi:hypothetical protein
MTRQDRAEPDTTRPPADDELAPHRSDEPIATGQHPVHGGAAHALADARDVLTAATRGVLDHRYGAELRGRARDTAHRRRGGLGPWRAPLPFTIPDPADLSAVAAWLVLYPATIAQLGDAGGLAARTAAVRKRAERLIVPPPREYFGYCDHCANPADDRVEPATVDLYADAGADTVRCPRCTGAWDARERRAWLLEQAGALWLPAPDIERALVDYVRDLYTVDTESGPVVAADHRPMTASAIRKHGERGRIQVQRPSRAAVEQAVAENLGRPQPRFLVGEVMALVGELLADQRARVARIRSAVA